MKRLFATPVHSTFADLALLVLRVASGVAFAYHGWGKIQKPFDWAGTMYPGPLQGLAALAEFGGGIAWALGFLTPLASFGLLCTMAVAIKMHAIDNRDAFVATGPGQSTWELAGLYFAIALVFMAVGPGRVSVDRILFGARGPR
jgi:putative oxidoreductase